MATLPSSVWQKVRRTTAAVAGALLFGALSIAFGVQPLAAQSGGSVYVPVVANGAPMPPVTPPVTPPTPTPGAPLSSDLIAAAEKAGSITHAQALEYTVYSLFNDARLPAQFRGAPSDDSQVMGQVRSAWATLPPQVQAALTPYLLPPNAPGSWNSPDAAAASTEAIEWRNVRSTKGVKVWYQTRYTGDDVKAAQLVAQIDGRIVTTLNDVMQRLWKGDDGLPHNGGDGLLDIYLVRGPKVSYRGLATPYMGCQQTAAWINLNSDRPIGDETHAGIIQTAAHEMMHTVQYTYALKEACATYDWLAEATAKWFEHHSYRNAQSEQPYAPSYLTTTYWPLENTANDRHYGAYLYFFYVAEKKGRPSIVRSAWQNAATMGSLEAVDSATSFGSNWGDFAVDNWNWGPDSDYQQWDHLLERAAPHSPPTAVTPGSGLHIYPIPATLEHMSIQYFHYTFADETARAITFFNGVTSNLSERPDNFHATDKYYQGDYLPLDQYTGIEVRAAYKIAGDPQWKTADWTLDQRTAFCRDKADERLEELVIILVNGERDQTSSSYTFNAQGVGPRLVVSNSGCWQFKGTLQVTSAGGEDNWDQFQIDVPEIVLERNDDWPSAYRLFDVKSGRGTISFRDHDEEQCTGADQYTDGPQAFTITPANIASWSNLMVPLALTGGPHVAAYAGTIASDAEISFHFICDDDPDLPGREDHIQTMDVGYLLRTPAWDAGDVKLSNDGGLLQNSYTMDGYTYTWTLRAVHEPAP
jgi:hypothetical protein